MLPEELTTAQLRVLSHPMRLAFLHRLREHGPATSRALGREFELDSGAASYHLRRLEAGHLIREDPALGTRRERWWRAVDDMSQFDPAAHGDDVAARHYVQSVVLMAADELRRVASDIPGARHDWLSEAAFIDLRLPLDGDGRRALRDEIMAVVDRHRHRAGDGAATAPTQVQLQIYEKR